ncbi:MAG: hypothetical protein E7271_09990 [Lachnospiraceae bacterium]|nr:hypothetical protein [Lachnospiraceae bacterium]
MSEKIIFENNIPLSAEPSDNNSINLNEYSVKELEDESKQRELLEIWEELREEITTLLDKCGIYYRIIGRVKSAYSLNKKLRSVNEKGRIVYQGTHKLQDLFGFRIMIYFIEDMPILKRLFTQHFNITGEGWTKGKLKPEEFRAISVNGVFELNNELQKKFSGIITNKHIDKTFEIQLRTVTFEGWLEIEHDYNYKINQMWKDQGEFLRRFHSILASLELCDDTMVTSLENLAYDVYARKRHAARYANEEIIYTMDNSESSKRYNLCDWDRMIRAHFRLKFQPPGEVTDSKQELDCLLAELFENQSSTNDSDTYKFAKYVLRFRKETLIKLLDTPKEYLNKIWNERPNKSSSQNQIWNNYIFKNKIPINVNSVIVLIMLYKEAKESSLSDDQRKLLAKASIMQYVTQINIANMFSIMDVNTSAFSVENKYKLINGWNTLYKNDVMLTTSYKQDEWRDNFTHIVLEDIQTIFASTGNPHDEDTIISMLKKTGLFQSTNLNSDQDCKYRYSIKYENKSIVYAAEYPGMFNASNYWRQIVEFVPILDVFVNGAQGITIEMRICIQYLYNETDNLEIVPAITIPNITKEIISHPNYSTHVAKPLVGQKKNNNGATYLTDILYLKRTEESSLQGISNCMELPLGLIYAITNKTIIHPIVLFVFDSENELQKHDATIAIFENSIGNIAYIYEALIKDENDDVFSQLYNSDKTFYDSFERHDLAKIDGPGIYVFSKKISSENDNNIRQTHYYEILFDTVEQYEFNNIVDASKPKNLHGLDGILEALRQELIIYNLHISNNSINSLINKYDDMFPIQ